MGPWHRNRARIVEGLRLLVVCAPTPSPSLQSTHISPRCCGSAVVRSTAAKPTSVAIQPALMGTSLLPEPTAEQLERRSWPQLLFSKWRNLCRAPYHIWNHDLGTCTKMNVGKSPSTPSWLALPVCLCAAQVLEAAVPWKLLFLPRQPITPPSRNVPELSKTIPNMIQGIFLDPAQWPLMKKLY